MSDPVDTPNSPETREKHLMDVFAFREELVSEYEGFSRSFTSIRAEDISKEIDGAYADGRFWPAPLIQLNPNFEQGESIDKLSLIHISEPTRPY